MLQKILSDGTSGVNGVSTIHTIPNVGHSVYESSVRIQARTYQLLSIGAH